MKHIDLLDISDVEMQKNMVLLIEDEDQELSGASSLACRSKCSNRFSVNCCL